MRAIPGPFCRLSAPTLRRSVAHSLPGMFAQTEIEAHLVVKSAGFMVFFGVNFGVIGLFERIFEGKRR